MKKHITAIIPAIVLLCGCAPSETQIQAACKNLNVAKQNMPNYERFFMNCVANASKDGIEDEAAISACSSEAERLYPVSEWYLPMVANTTTGMRDAYNAAHERNCGQ